MIDFINKSAPNKPEHYNKPAADRPQPDGGSLVFQNCATLPIEINDKTTAASYLQLMGNCYDDEA